jgi:hypothetical protein
MAGLQGSFTYAALAFIMLYMYTQVGMWRGLLRLGPVVGFLICPTDSFILLVRNRLGRKQSANADITGNTAVEAIQIT